MKDIFLSAKEVNKLKETNQNIIIFEIVFILLLYTMTISYTMSVFDNYFSN